MPTPSRRLKGNHERVTGGLPMSADSLRIAIVADEGRPYEALEAELTSAEREQASTCPTDVRRRQFAIGHIAAHRAIRRVLGTHFIQIEIIPGTDNRPLARVNGTVDQVSISISHSGRLAAACAWPNNSGSPVLAGVDLERTRPNEVADSTYAFSERERAMLVRAPEGSEVAALAMWTAKEAVWKALLAGQDIGPDSIEVWIQSIGQGHAMVEVKGQLRRRLARNTLTVRTRLLAGPDGPYILSVAGVASSRIVSSAISVPITLQLKNIL